MFQLTVLRVREIHGIGLAAGGQLVGQPSVGEVDITSREAGNVRASVIGIDPLRFDLLLRGVTPDKVPTGSQIRSVR